MLQLKTDTAFIVGVHNHFSATQLLLECVNCKQYADYFLHTEQHTVMQSKQHKGYQRCDLVVTSGCKLPQELLAWAKGSVHTAAIDNQHGRATRWRAGFVNK